MSYKKLICSLATLAVVIALSALEVDYFPRTMVAEYYPAPSESCNNRVYQGLNQIERKYNKGVLLPIRFYHSTINDELSSPAIDEYIESIEHLKDGTLRINNHRISDLSLNIESGKHYEYLVKKEYFKPSPIRIDASKIEISDRYKIEFTVEMLSEKISLQNATIRVVLIEDNIALNVTNVARDLTDSVFSLTGKGNKSFVNASFLVDDSWNIDNLKAIAYVIDNDGDIIQATSSYEVESSYLRAVHPACRIGVGPSDDLFEADYFTLFFYGSEIELTIDIVAEESPEDWFVGYCDDQGSCFFGPYDFQMTDGETASFHANVIPDGPGMIDYHFAITSPTFFGPYLVPARFITDDVDVMIVDGDGWEDYESQIADILEKNEYSFGIWDTSMADIEEAASSYNLVWVTGEKEPALSKQEIGFLKEHLDKGKSLFISGQHIGTYLTEHEFYKDKNFYSGYLNASMLYSDSGIFTLSGVENDPVSDGLEIVLNGGDSADNQLVPAAIAPVNNSRGEAILYYDRELVGAIRTLNRQLNGAVIYLAFGFEGINDASVREQLLINSLNWFSTTGVEETNISGPTVSSMKLYPSFPNPFVRSIANTSSVMIAYSLPNNSEKKTNLSIFNIKGQLIKRFDNISQSAGSVEWNGCDSSGNLVANGVYFYVLSNGREEIVKKLSVVR